MDNKEKISFAINQIPINNCDGSANEKAIKAVRLLQEVHSSINNQSPIQWVEYDFNDPTGKPSEYGRYLVERKDGKIHWEIWNSTSWAYNENSIVAWAKITKRNK